MSYKALYRTYRPSTFEEVAGQQHIVKTLSNALKENKIAHAYLFCGPRGTGKTTMARLFAKALNCEEGFGCQCNHCQNCIAISEGSHPDVIEIDAASNRGIDDIRDIISKVKYSPIKGKWKVYIIDEVHMMTTEAFNALLKTLEEPPEHVVFILATTEPFKLMPTILSRVQRYDFSKISSKDLLNNLKRVCTSEGLEVDDEALNMIVSLSDGGGRDSLSMLDQAIAYAGNHLELHHVQELFGLSTLDEKLSIINALDNKDVLSFTTKLDELCDHGVDIKRLTTELIDIVKDLLIFKTTADYTILKVLPHNVVDSYSINKDKLLFMLDVLMNCYSQYRFVSNIRSILEVGFLKIASYEASGETKTIVKEVIVEKQISPKTNVVQDTPKPVAQPVIEKSTPVVEEKKPTLVKEESKKVEPVSLPKETVQVSTPIDSKLEASFSTINSFVEFNGNPLVLNDEDTINIMIQGSKVEKANILEVWETLEQYLSSPKIGKYVATLRSCSPRVVAKNAIILETKFNHVAQKVSFKENQNGFSKIIETLTGKKYYILVITSDEAIRRIKKFSDLRQINKLPNPKPIYFDFTCAEQPRQKTATEMFVDDINK